MAGWARPRSAAARIERALAWLGHSSSMWCTVSARPAAAHWGFLQVGSTGAASGLAKRARVVAV